MRFALVILTFALAGLAAAAAIAEPPNSSRPSQRFVDCKGCPRMVVVPAGEFLIGSPDDEVGRYDDREGPRRRIRISRFAVSATEITRRQYAAFVRDTGRPTPNDCPGLSGGSSFAASKPRSYGSWASPGFPQTDDHPVVCVSWEDATDYTRWLAAKTRQPYRLLSESEWEYAARGGTATPFFWGRSTANACRYVNASDPSLVRALPAWIDTVQREEWGGDRRAGILPCDDGYAFTAPVAHYAPNPFGLYDMIGNVWEHVADCFTPGAFEQMPDDGRPQERADCQQRRVRGGSWDDYAIDLRSARRTSGLSPTQRRNDTGFRIARPMS